MIGGSSVCKEERGRWFGGVTFGMEEAFRSKKGEVKM